MKDLEQELEQVKEENRRLEQEKRSRLVHEALDGLHGPVSKKVVAITGPIEGNNEPVIYACQELLVNEATNFLDPLSDFVRMRECTLLDLMNASLWVNGVRMQGVFRQACVGCTFKQDMRIPEKNSTREEVLDAVSDQFNRFAASYVYRYNSDSIDGFDIIDHIGFHLEDIDEDRLFRYIQDVIMDDLSLEPGSSGHDLEHEALIQRSMDYFGPEAKVIFDRVR